MSSHNSFRNYIQQSSEWLLRNQDPTGGWGRTPGQIPSVLNTAEAMLALLDGKVQPNHEALQKAAHYLKSRQTKKGNQAGVWMRRSGKRANPDIVRTSFILQALTYTEGGNCEAVKLGVNWLLAHGNADGGWGFKPGGPSALMATYYALMSLLAAYSVGCEHKDRIKNRIDKGLGFFVKTYRHHSGYFGSDPSLTGTHTIHAAMLLQTARDGGFTQYEKEEWDAIDWLLRNQDQAKASVAETLPINDLGDYKFLYIDDALLLKVLARAQDERHRKSELAAQLVNELIDRRDPEGGFPGEQSTSYSTAKALSGLAMASSVYADIPSRSTQYVPNAETAKTIGLLLVLIVVATVGLALADRLNVSATIMLVVSLLSGMTIYKVIGPENFVALFGKGLDVLGEYFKKSKPTPPSPQPES